MNKRHVLCTQKLTSIGQQVKHKFGKREQEGKKKPPTVCLLLSVLLHKTYFSCITFVRHDLPSRNEEANVLRDRAAHVLLTSAVKCMEPGVRPAGRRNVELVKDDPSEEVASVLRLEEVSQIALGRERGEGEETFLVCLPSRDTKGSTSFKSESQ